MTNIEKLKHILAITNKTIDVEKERYPDDVTAQKMVDVGERLFDQVLHMVNTKEYYDLTDEDYWKVKLWELQLRSALVRYLADLAYEVQTVA